MSELLYQSWKAFSEKSAGAIGQTHSADLANMEYHNIINMETNNVMKLAVKKFPSKVTNMRDTNDPTTGHGKFVPGDDAYTALSNTPLVKLMQNVIADHVGELNNPCKSCLSLK